MASSGIGPVIGSMIAPLSQDFRHPTPLSEASSLPKGFPDLLHSQLAWSGQQFVDESHYVHTLSEQDLQEVDVALRAFKALGLDGDLACRDNFQLPTVGPKLDRLRGDIHNGKGFGIIRGLDPRRYSMEDLTVLYLGLQSYIADCQGRQDRKGNMMVHIIADNSTKLKAEHHRHSTSPITFHNEETGDIVSWLTRSTALSGGKCVISSAYTVYNVLAATRPDLIRILARSDWPFALPKFQCRPIIFYQDGRLITNFGRAALIGSASHIRPAHLPRLSCGQLEALDAIETIAEATRLEFHTQAGDIHFINNLAILHRRDGFVNGTTANQQRHLVRMRLRDEEMGWNIPLDLQNEWNRAFDRNNNRVWHLEPMPSGFFPLRSQPN